MAGGTKSYKVTLDADGKPVKELVSFHPKYAARPAAAVAILRNGGAYAHVAPHDWQAFVTLWGDSGA